MNKPTRKIRENSILNNVYLHNRISYDAYQVTHFIVLWKLYGQCFYAYKQFKIIILYSTSLSSFIYNHLAHLCQQSNNYSVFIYKRKFQIHNKWTIPFHYVVFILSFRILREKLEMKVQLFVTSELCYISWYLVF